MKQLLKVLTVCLMPLSIFAWVPSAANGEVQEPKDLQSKVLKILQQKAEQKKVLEQLSKTAVQKKASVTKSEAKEEEEENYHAEGYVPSERVKSAMAADQSVVDKLFQQAQAYRQQGKGKQSQEHLSQIIDLDPSYSRARLLLARDLIVEERYVDVESLLLPLLHKSNTDWRPWFLAGTAQLMLDNLELATYSLDKALSEEGRYQAPVWIQRAIVEQQLNRPQAALRLLSTAAELDPEDPQIYINMAYAYEDIGDSDKAKAYYQRFLESPLGTARNNALRQHVAKHLAKGRQMSALRLQP